MTASAGELWLAAFQRLAARAAHEIRNPLNGVVVNLEVLRGRLGRPEADPARLATFAELASGEISRSAALIEALLSLARPPSADAVDLRQVLEPLVVLYGAIATRHGGSLEVVPPPGGANQEAGGTVPVDALSARLVIASILEHSIDGETRVRCWTGRLKGDPTVTVMGERSRPEDPGMERILAAVPAVRIERDLNGVTIVFPAAGGMKPGV